MQQNGSTVPAEEWVTTSNAFLSALDPNFAEEKIFSNPLCEQQELSEADFFTLSLNPLYREYIIPEEYLQLPPQPQQQTSSPTTSSPSLSATPPQTVNVNYEAIEISPMFLSQSHSPSPNMLSPLSATLLASSTSPTVSAPAEPEFPTIPSLPITPLFHQKQVVCIEEMNEEEELFEIINPLYQGDQQNSIFPNGWCQTDVERLVTILKESVYNGPHCIQQEPFDNLSFAGVVGDKLKACMHGEAMLNALLSGSCMHPEALYAILQPSTTAQTAIFQSISLSAFIVEGVVEESTTPNNNNSSSPTADNVVEEKLSTLTREDAKMILQQLVEQRVLVTLPYHPFGHEFNEHKYYRHIEDDLAAYYEDVINVKSKPGTSDDTSPVATYLVMRKIEENMSALLQKYVDYDEGYVDYRSISNSEVFRNIILLSPKLRKIQVSVLGAAKKSFFINLYNMMALHALLTRGCDSTMKAREAFSMTNFYFLEHHKICLDDILHGVLRKQKALQSKYHIEQFASEEETFDPRIHFVISNGAASCALPRAVTFETCETAIEEATKQFINLETDIVETFDVKEITISSIFRDYSQDFGPSILSSIAFIGKYLPPERRGIIERWLQNENIKNVDEVLAWSLEDHIKFFAAKGPYPLKFRITFREHEWTSQRKGSKPYYKKKESATPSAASEPASATTPSTPASATPAGLPQVTPEILQRKKKLPLPVVKETPALLGFFRQFCNNEFSSENLQFYDMYLQYLTLTTFEERFEKAQLLYDTFLSTKAETEVNVSRKKVKAVEELLSNARKERQSKESTENMEKFIPELFDSLMAEVDLVIADSYARFCVSELYQDMIEDVFIKPQIQEKTTGKRRTSLKLSLKSIISGGSTTSTNPSPMPTSEKNLTPQPQPSPRSASVIQSPSVVSKLASIKPRSTFTSPSPRPPAVRSPRNESSSLLLSPTSLNHKSHSDSHLLTASLSPRVEDKAISVSASTSPVIPFDTSKESTEIVVVATNTSLQDEAISTPAPISLSVPEPEPTPIPIITEPKQEAPVQIPVEQQESSGKKEQITPIEQKATSPSTPVSEIEVIKVETVAVPTVKPLVSPRETLGKTEPQKKPLMSPRQENQKTFLPRLDFSTAKSPETPAVMSARGIISTEGLVKPSQLLKRSNSADSDVAIPPTKPVETATQPVIASAGSSIAASVAGTHNKVSVRLSQRIAMFQFPKGETLPTQPRSAELDRLRTRSIVSTVKGSNTTEKK